VSIHIERLFIEQGLDERTWQALIAFVEEKRISPCVDAIFPFENIIEAHRRLESRQNIGKVVVQL
jgi:NADPH:quinone reductase-like Zn-dependent oxidoreductase